MPLLKQKLFARLQNSEPGVSGTGDGEGEKPPVDGGLDIEAASDSIGADLGLVIDDAPPEPLEPPAPAQTAASASAPVVPTVPAPAASTPPGAPLTFSAEKPPHTWSATAAAGWSALPLEARTEIAKREADMFRGLEQYRTEATFAREVNGLLKPLESALQQHNVAPARFIGNLVHAHTVLDSKQYTNEQKLTFATQLMATYGIELTPSAAGGSNPEFVDPQVKTLQDKLAAVESRLGNEDARKVSEAREKIAGDIKAFAENPANPYFDEVADEVAILIRGSDGKMPLQEAYDKAVYANPVTRAKETSRLTSEAVAKAQKDAREKTAAAKLATGANVKTGEHQGSGTAATGSMEDTMAATLAAIKKR